MKKIIAVILVLAFVLSLTACQKNEKYQNSTNSEQTTTTNTSVAGNSSKNSSKDDLSFEGVTSFEEFKDELDNSSLKPIITETEEGVTVIEISNNDKDDEVVTSKKETPTNQGTTSKNTSTNNPFPNTNPTTDTTVAPVVPTIDKVQTSVPAEPTPESTPTTTPANPAPPPTPDITNPTPAPEKEKEPEFTYTTGQKHEKLHYSGRYLYSILNDEQKEWYRTIDEAVNNLDAEVTINADVSKKRDYYIFYVYAFDNPEHFYLCNSVGLCNNGDGTSTLNFYYSVGNQPGEYCGYGYGPLTDELREKIRAKKAVFEQEVNRIISTIPANAPDVWKEKLVYDHILMDGHYNLNAKWDGLANDNWTAYGLLVNKYGVCESYSEAFQTLCLYVGIKCTGVVGTAGGGHKWNAVELDGEWYMCDITFDDPIGGEEGAAYHYYFNRTSEWFIEYGHDWTNCDFDVPECNGTKYDFGNCFGTERW